MPIQPQKVSTVLKLLFLFLFMLWNILQTLIIVPHTLSHNRIIRFYKREKYWNRGMLRCDLFEPDHLHTNIKLHLHFRTQTINQMSGQSAENSHSLTSIFRQQEDSPITSHRRVLMTCKERNIFLLIFNNAEIKRTTKINLLYP